MLRLCALSLVLAFGCLAWPASGQQVTAGGEEGGFVSHFVRAPGTPCRQHYSELASYLVRLAQEAAARAEGAGPCEHKRNSELINSLLGLPKTMNDAGRRR